VESAEEKGTVPLTARERLPFRFITLHRTISGSRSLVTGASGGIGRAIALELARHGSQVVLLARREEQLKSVAKEITASGGRAEWVVGDVSDPAARRAALDRARDRFGGLDILVNNAGIGALGRFDEADPARIRRLFEVNFFAAAELIREALPQLKQGARPIVVNIGSILGHFATPRSSEYCATKFALRGFTDALRAEFAAMGIDVLLVSPGTTESEFFEHVVEETSAPRWAKQRGIPAEAVARASVRAIRRGRAEIIPNARGRLVCLLNRLWPGLLRRILARYG
jgi:short-subunit dehydrogenase